MKSLLQLPIDNINSAYNNTQGNMNTQQQQDNHATFTGMVSSSQRSAANNDKFKF